MGLGVGGSGTGTALEHQICAVLGIGPTLCALVAGSSGRLRGGSSSLLLLRLAALCEPDGPAAQGLLARGCAQALSQGAMAWVQRIASHTLPTAPQR